MKRAAALRLCLSLLVCSVVCISAAQTVANKQSVLSQARQSYYNLRSEGLNGFECSIQPDWKTLLENQLKDDAKSTEGQDKEDPKNDGAAEERRKNIQRTVETLNQIHFTVNLGPDNSVKLTHNELTGQSDQMMAALKQIYGGMEQMASGFFDTWKMFLLSPPFPDVSGQYQLEAAGPQYRLSYREELADVVTTMGRDFAISNLKVTTPDFDSTIQPTFSRTPKGFLLNAYEASYKSQKPEETTQLKVSMDYEDVQGLKMLQKLSLSGTYGGSPFAIGFTFSDCRVLKRQSQAAMSH